MDQDTYSMRSILPQKELTQFYTKPPNRSLTSHENHELLESNFFTSLYNLMHQYILREMSQNDVNYSLVPWKTIIQSIEDHQLQPRIGEYSGVENTQEFSTNGNEIRDIQGILWDRIQSRKESLIDRRLNHTSFTNIFGSKQSGALSTDVDLFNDLRSWNFRQYFTSPNPRMSHFQLINQTLCCDKNKNIYFIELIEEKEMGLFFNVVKKINSSSGDMEIVLSLEESPCDRITVIECFEDLLLVGTLNGTLYVMNLITDKIKKKQITNNPNGIVNSIRATKELIIVSINSGELIKIDRLTFSIVSNVTFPWAINSISISPLNYNLKLIAGDNLNAFIMDDRVHESKPVEILKGHYDYSFSCDWSNDGLQLVTTNQDCTVRLFDVRNVNQSQWCFGGEYEDSAIRTAKFNKSGKYLAFNESIDTINIVDLQELREGSECGSKKVINVFGKLTNPVFMDYDEYGSEILTVGVSDRSVGGILQYFYENQEERCMDFDCW